MMKNILLFSFIILLVSGCTKLGEPTMHPSEWTDPNSDNSHVAKIITVSNQTCSSCHGGNFKGGTSKVSCYQCHEGGPSGHPNYSIWVGSSDNPNFHGKDDIARCTTCHGDDYLGGMSEVSCYQCHNGPSGHPNTNIWVDTPSSPNFHGKDDIARCTTCHGDDYLGGTSGVSCYECHDGPNAYACQDFTPPPSTHTIVLERDDCEALHSQGFSEPFDNGCATCHGTDLAGGYGPSCFTCHGTRWE